MRALSQSEYGEIRSLYESIYTPQVDEELELSVEELTEAVEDAVLNLLKKDMILMTSKMHLMMN